MAAFKAHLRFQRCHVSQTSLSRATGQPKDGEGLAIAVRNVNHLRSAFGNQRVALVNVLEAPNPCYYLCQLEFFGAMSHN